MFKVLHANSQSALSRASMVTALSLFVALALPACSPDDKDTGETGDGHDSDDTEDTSDILDSDDTVPDETEIEDTSGGELFSNLKLRLHDHVRSLVYLSWDQGSPATGHVEYSFDEGVWLQTPERSFGQGSQEQLLLGIPYDTAYTFRLVLDPGTEALSSNDHSSSTGHIPGGLPLPDLLQYDSDQAEPTGRYLIGSINSTSGGWTGGDYWKWILDRQGRVVWASLTPDRHWSIYLRVSYDGCDLLWDEATYWADWDVGAGSTVHRMKIDFSNEEITETPGLHHVFTELPDQTLVWGAAMDIEDSLDEYLVEVRPDGTRNVIWTCNEYLASQGASPHCQSNSLYWHEATDTFLYSFYTSNSVFEIDHSTGAVLHNWGHLPTSWPFDPVDSAFWWQHGVTYTDEGTLLLSTRATQSGGETAAREYIVDDKTSELRQIWSFGVGQGVYAATAGEAHRLPNDNTLHNYGAGGVIREVTMEGEVVWELDWNADKLLGRTIFIEDLYDLAP